MISVAVVSSWLNTACSLQHPDDELHRGVVVVVQQHFVAARALDLLLGLGALDHPDVALLAALGHRREI